MRLDDELDRAIGDGPPHRPVAERIEAGRRTVRRRRGLATGAAALAVVAVVGGVWSTTNGDDGGSRSDSSSFAGEPDAGRGDGLDPGEPVGLDDDCALLTAPDVDVVDRIDDPFPPPGGADDAAGDCVVAVAFEQQGVERWTVLEQSTAVDEESGIISSMGGAMVPVRAIAGTTFAAWVERMSPPDDAAAPRLPRSFPGPAVGVVYFEDQERLLPEPGVSVLEQTGDVELRDFTEPGDRSAAAAVEIAGDSYFVLAREADGFAEYFIDEAREGETLEQFLQRAGELYDSGAGLL